MSNTAAITLDTSNGIIARLMASIDGLLAASARIALRIATCPISVFEACKSSSFEAPVPDSYLRVEVLLSTNGSDFRSHFSL